MGVLSPHAVKGGAPEVRASSLASVEDFIELCLCRHSDDRGTSDFHLKKLQTYVKVERIL